MSRQDETTREPFFGRALSAAPAGVILPAVLILCYIVQINYTTTPAREDELLTWTLSRDALEQGRWWTLFTHMFLHANWLHIGMNAATALSISTPVALAVGRGLIGFVKFWILFLLCGFVGGLAFIAIEPGNVPALGASGAISGLWGAMVRVPMPYAPGPLDAPWSRKALMLSVPFLLINVLLMAVLAYFKILPVAWEAHLGGFIAGMILISFFAVRAPRQTGIAGPWGERHG